jgi:hypothetical protein
MNESAKNIAAAIVGAAQEHGFIDGQLTVVEALAEMERTLFLRMMAALRRHQQRKGSADLTLDEISSMFTFVFAKAAEILTDYVNRQVTEIDTAGLFDGKVPLYVDERMAGFLKKCEWPAVAAEAFLNREPDEANPLLALFEALKWCYRVSLDISIGQLEECGIVLE